MLVKLVKSALRLNDFIIVVACIGELYTSAKADNRAKMILLNNLQRLG